MEETGHTSLNNGRASHNIGRLGNLLRVIYISSLAGLSFCSYPFIIIIVNIIYGYLDKVVQ